MNIFARLLVFLLTFSLLPLSAQNVGLIPSPQQLECHEGTFVWNQPHVAFSTSASTADFLMGQLADLPECGVQHTENAENAENAEISFVQVGSLPVPMFEQQAYTLLVKDNRIEIQAVTEQGLFYGMQSLKQLYRYNYRMDHTEYQFVEIPCMSIVDYPQMEWRGWMDDISRGPIPTMDFLKKQVRILSEFKLNCFTLYTENTFQSSKYNYAPEGALTAEEIRELEAYARKYYVELIGNQQCFAHLEKILALPEYSHLADSKWNLNPAIGETYDFLQAVLDEEMSCYSSPLFNINCDETEQLGSGAAAKYVKKVGASAAYSRHIKRVHDMLARRGKTTLMWADIVLKDNKIRDALPKDIQMLVWSYAPSDQFRTMIQPVKDAGFDFWVVPGNSMWSTVFPIMSSYEKNIANFARDGHQLGAKGLINTAWNDSGEALLNSSWHAFAWGAEMSWKPLKENDSKASEMERTARLSIFDTNFNFQFFHFYNNENIIADFLRAASRYQESAVNEVYTTASLWSFCPWQLFPPLLSENAMADLKEERLSLTFTIQLLQLILSEQAQYENPEIIYCAVQAVNRLWNDVLSRKYRIDLYNYMQNPDPVDAENLKTTNADLCYWLLKLQQGYSYLWGLEYRPYWKSVVDARYERQVRQLQETQAHVFITTPRRAGGLWLEMETVFHDRPIYYTLDGSEPTTSSPQYRQPLSLREPCRVRTLTLDDSLGNVYCEKELCIHLGLWAQAVCSSEYSRYRAEYSGGGPDALFDGERGSNSYRDGKWQGFQGDDVTVTYRWPHDTLVNEVVVSYLHHYNDWILAPEVVEIYTEGKDGKMQLVRRESVGQIQVGGTRCGEITVSDLGVHTDCLQVVVRNPGPLPPAHSGAGQPSYLFLDEILIR